MSVRRAVLLVALACAALAPGSSQGAPDGRSGPARVDYAYTVVAPRSVSPSQLVARTIAETPNARCPVIVARTAKRTLRLRMTRLPTPFGSVGFEGITVCRRSLPAGLRRASVGGRKLPLLPRGTPGRIAILGDTGCRIQETPPTPPATEPSYAVQDCNSPTAWPLRTIAREIAAAKPALVVHTGDFFYREADCPTSGPLAPLCAGSPPVNPPGSPNEDTWAVWKADWFAPARSLFAAAPLFLARGNHETCNRGGTGFFYLLEPGVSAPDTCQRAYRLVDPEEPPPALAQPTWVARLGALDLVMLDSSSANDTEVENADVYVALGRRAVSLLRARRATGWLVSHRPVYAWERFGGPESQPSWTNATLEFALDGLIRPFAAVVSGHLHLFQTVEIPERPAQLTIGDGGTMLDPADQGGTLPTFGPLHDVPGATPAPPPTRGVTSFTFGWMLMRPTGRVGVFDGVRYEPGEGEWGRCRLAPHEIDCQASQG